LAGNELPLLLTCQIIVPGERVATLAKQKGFSLVTIAENASDESMLYCLKKLAVSH